jgi:hypothetical protein
MKVTKSLSSCVAVTKLEKSGGSVIQHLIQKMIQKQNIHSLFCKIVGLLLFFSATYVFISAIIKFISFDIFFNEIFGCLFILLISLLIIFHYYTVDEDNFSFHFLFFKNNISINSFVEIRYVFWGLFLLTVRKERTLREYRTIVMQLFCTRNQSKKKMAGFFEVLSKKNMSCVINI